MRLNYWDTAKTGYGQSDSVGCLLPSMIQPRLPPVHPDSSSFSRFAQCSCDKMWVGVMKKRFIIVPFLFLLLAVAAYLLWPSNESRIKKLFNEGAKALERKDLDAVMSKVSYNYRDDYGLTYLSLKETLKREFANLSDISVEYELTKIQVKDNTATAELQVRISATRGTEAGYIMGDIKTPLPVKFTLEKEHTKWLIAKTEKVEGS